MKLSEPIIANIVMNINYEGNAYKKHYCVRVKESRVDLSLTGFAERSEVIGTFDMKGDVVMVSEEVRPRNWLKRLFSSKKG